MSVYALSPILLNDFVSAFDTACQSPDGWKLFLSVLGRVNPPGVARRFRPPILNPALRHLRQPVIQSLAAAEEIGEPLVDDAIPSPQAHARILQLFARWTARAEISPNETNLFLQAHTLVQDRPQLTASREWRFICDRFLKPGRIPLEFPFLKADPDNSTASCMAIEEVVEFIALEREERLLESGLLGLGSDSQALLGMLHLGASERCMVWHYEYA